MMQYPSTSMLLLRLKREGYRTNKRLGQHFLSDEYLLSKIADLTGADEKTLVIEIGPGPATLTAFLAQRAGGVVAIEKDSRLRSFHEEIFGKQSNLEFIYADALQVDLWALAREKAAAMGAEKCILAGNIPFQITSPLLFGQIGEGRPWNRMVLMIQREVADRITASPHSRDYGILTVKLAYWWKVVERLEIGAEKFTPRPKVDATTLVMEPIEPEEEFKRGWPAYSKFVDLCFNQRRKKLYNSPAATAAGGRDAFRNALEKIGVDANVRAEDLSPEEFLRLYRRTSSMA